MRIVQLLCLSFLIYGQGVWSEEAISAERHTWLVETLQSEEVIGAAETTSGDQSDFDPELRNKIEKQLVECRYKESALDALIPDFFQDSWCEDVLTEAFEAGVSLTWLTNIVDSFDVEEEDTEGRKVYVY